ncbi:MAG: hypothetical protein Q9190_001774 [Brigantiaea leucoxantha]
MNQSNISALPPPPGVISDFEHPASRTLLTIVPSAAIVGFMIITVFIRIYTKLVAEANVGIIVSCMPTFPALFKDVSSQIRITRQHRQRRRSSKYPSKGSTSKPHAKKPSNSSIETRSEPDHIPKPKVPPKNHIVELEAGYPPEPQSYFSDDSSDYDWLA